MSHMHVDSVWLHAYPQSLATALEAFRNAVPEFVRNLKYVVGKACMHALKNKLSNPHTVMKLDKKDWETILVYLE